VLAFLPLADPLNAPALDGAIVAAYATTLDGTPIYARNETLRVMPASNQKLFSAAFALNTLGPDARQATRIWKEADRNVVEAEGDPLLTRAELLNLDLDRRKPVYVAQAYAPGIPSGWENDDLKDRYAASVYALSVDTASFELWGEHGRPQLRPEPYGVKIERQKAEKLDWIYDPFARRLIVKGPLPEKATRIDTLATPRADFAAASLLGRNPRATTEVPNRAPDIVLPGHTVAEAVAACLPPSDNNIAEHLLLNAATKFGPLGEDPYATATTRLRNFAERTVGLPFEDVLPRDGSGLGRGNLVTARAMVGLLRWADRQPTRELWRNALAKGGGPGTLRNRLTDVEFRGKTGSLSRVAALSGYLKRRDGSEAVVSVIVNHYAGSDAAVRAAMDAWVRSLD
jgi:D-alanyl-D-alanine carboxypeptidase/D-alanyl-D-alanine-endopeptidase (penicillin-binding protein 4)